MSDQVGQNLQELKEENDCNWLKEFQDDKFEQTEKKRRQSLRKEGDRKSNQMGTTNKRRVRNRTMKFP